MFGVAAFTIKSRRIKEKCWHWPYGCVAQATQQKALHVFFGNYQRTEHLFSLEMVFNDTPHCLSMCHYVKPGPSCVHALFVYQRVVVTPEHSLADN